MTNPYDDDDPEQDDMVMVSCVLHQIWTITRADRMRPK